METVSLEKLKEQISILEKRGVPKELIAILRPGDRVVFVKIRGLPPGLLMNNPKSMKCYVEGKRVCVHNVPITERCDACIEARAYRKADGELYIPSRWIYNSLVRAFSSYKIKGARGKRFTAADVAGLLAIFPTEIGLGVKSYQVHESFVVIQRNRVIRYRPWLPEWQASFWMKIDQSFGTNLNKVRMALEDAGSRIGIGDYRPAKKGPFGRFIVESFEVII